MLHPPEHIVMPNVQMQVYVINKQVLVIVSKVLKVVPVSVVVVQVLFKVEHVVVMVVVYQDLLYWQKLHLMIILHGIR